MAALQTTPTIFATTNSFHFSLGVNLEHSVWLKKIRCKFSAAKEASTFL